MAKTSKPTTLLVDSRYLDYFASLSDKGHTILSVDMTEIDAIISPVARLLNPGSTFINTDKQIEIILKSIRFTKYPNKPRVRKETKKA